MIVISTGLHTPELARARCLRSVKEQVGVDVEHRVFDAELPDPASPWAHFQILSECLKSEAPDTIVVSLDLDDWLARPDALAIVQKHHDDGAWVTYGSYKHADGRPGHCEQLKGDPRKVPWVTSHLKTFRAGLFQRITATDLRFDGDWLPHARDLALMFPMLEMAGRESSHFVPEVLVTYNYANAVISTELELSSRTKKGAFESAVTSITDSALNVLGNDCEISLFGGSITSTGISTAGTGFLSQIGTSTSVSSALGVLVLANAFDVNRFSFGQELDLYWNNAGTITKRINIAGNGLFVGSVDRTYGYLYIVNAAGTAIAINSVFSDAATNDFIWLRVSRTI